MLTFGHVQNTGIPICIKKGRYAGCKGEIKVCRRIQAVPDWFTGAYECLIFDSKTGKSFSLQLRDSEFDRV